MSLFSMFTNLTIVVYMNYCALVLVHVQARYTVVLLLIIFSLSYTGFLQEMVVLE